MAAQAVHVDSGQLALYGSHTTVRPPTQARVADAHLCAGCRAREARYGFGQDDPEAERPRTLCFQCFRIEVGRRQAVAARLARGWNGTQVTLPLDRTLESLSRRRHRAQIAARHALELR